MKPRTDATDLMIRYLLGEASEDEQLRLEEQFFTDEEAHEQLQALEDELRYDYAQGGLTPHQRKLFEKRFLATPADEARVNLAKAVLARSFEQAAEWKTVAEPKRNWWQALSEMLTPKTAMQFSFASAAALLVVAFGVTMMFETMRLRNQVGDLQASRIDQQKSADALVAQQKAQQDSLSRQLEEERSRREQLEKSGTANRPTLSIFSFVLTPGLTRDVEGPKRVVVPSDAGEVQLQLDVKAKDIHPKYKAALQTLDGVELWSQNITGAASGVVVKVPARILKPGDYVVELKGVTQSGESERAGEYYFTVVRK